MRRIEHKRADGKPEVRSFVLQVRAVNEDGTIEGYGSVFGVQDDYDDVIASGAFAESLKEHKAAGTMPAMLWQHDSDDPIGVWTEMVEDEKGLRCVGKLALGTSKGAEARELLKIGALNGLSIGFVSKSWEYDAETDVRTLTAVDLWEVSLVTFPANRAARITNVKGADVSDITTIRQAEKALRDAGFSPDAAKAFIASVKHITSEERDVPDVDVALKAASRLQSLIKS